MKWRLAMVGAAAAAAVLPLPAGFVERWYSNLVFPALQTLLTSASNLVPFALFDLLILTTIVWFVWRLVADIRARCARGNWRVAGRAALRLVTAAACFYLAFLAAWGLNYRRMPLEDRLAPVLACTPADLSFPARRKVPWLVEDLRYLGCDPAALDQIPRCREIPATGQLSSALGCLYVLEGATLGGKVIRPHVEQRLGLGPGRGCTFFSSYGDEVGDMWQRFCRILCNFTAATPDVNDEIVDAAADTFTSFDRWVAGGAA